MCVYVCACDRGGKKGRKREELGACRRYGAEVEYDVWLDAVRASEAVRGGILQGLGVGTAVLWADSNAECQNIWPETPPLDHHPPRTRNIQLHNGTRQSHFASRTRGPRLNNYLILHIQFTAPKTIAGKVLGAKICHICRRDLFLCSI